MNRIIPFLIIFLWVSMAGAVDGRFINALQSGKHAQTISACSYSSTTPFTVGDSDRAVTCTASSVLSCSLSTNNSSICTIVSGAVHAVGAGTCTVYCDQAGDGHWFAAAQANQSITVSAGGDSCTGTLVTSAHFENDDTITNGTPAGCNSNAAQKWTIADHAEYSGTQKSDGSYAFHTKSTTWNNKTGILTVNGTSAAGAIVLDVYVVTGLANGSLALLTADATNKIDVYMSTTTTDVGITYTGGGSGISCVDTNHYLTTNGWHTVIAKWSQTAVGGKYLSVQIDANAATTCAVALNTFTGTPSQLQVGNNVWSACEIYIDKVKLYNAWAY